MGRRPLAMAALLVGIGLLAGSAATPAWARKSYRTIAKANGAPIRTVYVDAESAIAADSAVTQLHDDTCLTVVSKPTQADAVLEVGMALPAVGGGGGSSQDGFGSSSQAPMLGGGTKKKPKRRASATCSDGKETGACTSSDSIQGGDAAPEQAATWTGNVGSALDVSLVSPANASDELWQAEERSKHSWSEQLRVAAGCPVCPGERFDPKHDKMTYRQWMQTKCPNVLAAATR